MLAGRPIFFLSSLYTHFVALRQQAAEWGSKNGINIWVAEIEHPNLRLPKGSTEKEREDYSLRVAEICLEAVRASEAVIFIFGGYGSLTFPFERAMVTVLELELFQAILQLKPLYVFRLESAVLDPRLEGLLQILQSIHPQLFLTESCTDSDDALKKIRSLIERKGRSIEPQDGGMHKAFARQLRELLPGNDARLKDNENEKPLRFLDGLFVGVSGAVPDPMLIERLIAGADSTLNEATRLAYLWVAVRHLAAVPYDRPEFAPWLPAWEAVLRRWASAAAWYGLHGFLALGRLAAVNSLREIAALTAPPAGEAERSIHASHGALASEYYSMAKLVSIRKKRRTLLKTALRHVNQALASGGNDPSGLFLIKGPIELSLGNRWAALRSFRMALAVRIASNEGPGRIGEAEAHLGFAQLSVLRVWTARRYLQSGVLKLEQHRPDGFFVIAVKKLGYCHCMLLETRAARAEFERAYRFALERCYFDQAIQVDGILQTLPLNANRFGSFLWVVRNARRLVRRG